jgi:LacI family transcriptional regulator
MELKRISRGCAAGRDDTQAADDMTSYLINHGHRRIGFFKGHQSHMSPENRLFGYRRALDRAGIKFDPVLVHEGSGQSHFSRG